MSGKATGEVWEFDLPQNEKLVCLSMADHADHNGEHIFPSIAFLAWKTGYSYRQVQRLINKLIEKNAVRQVKSGKTKGEPSLYAIDYINAPRLRPFREKQVGSDITVSDPQNDTENAVGSDITVSDLGRTSESPTGYDTQVSDITVNEPSKKRKDSSASAGKKSAPAHKKTTSTPERKCAGPYAENLQAVSAAITDTPNAVSTRFGAIASWVSGGEQTIGTLTVEGLDPYASPDEIALFSIWYKERMERQGGAVEIPRKLDLWLEWFPQFRADTSWQNRYRRRLNVAKRKAAQTEPTAASRVFQSLVHQQQAEA